MEWLDKIKDFPNLIQQEPRYGYLVVAGLLLIWLVGVICGWKWTYSRPGSTGGNFWMNLLGPKTFPCTCFLFPANSRLLFPRMPPVN